MARDVVPGAAVLSMIRTRTPMRVRKSASAESGGTRADDQDVTCFRCLSSVFISINFPTASGHGQDLGTGGQAGHADVSLATDDREGAPGTETMLPPRLRNANVSARCDR